MNFYLSENELLMNRAAWVVNNILDQVPTLIQPFVSVILNRLQYGTLKTDTFLRNTFRVLSRVSIAEEHREQAIDLAFHYFTDKNRPVAIRAHCMRLLGDTLIYYPEIAAELILMIEDELPYGTSGFKNRGQRTINHLKKYI